jgi:hypothetical protein
MCELLLWAEFLMINREVVIHNDISSISEMQSQEFLTIASDFSGIIEDRGQLYQGNCI